MKVWRAQAEERRRGAQARARGDALWAAGDKDGSTRAHQRATAYEEERRAHSATARSGAGRRLSDADVREKAHVAFCALRLLLDGGHVPDAMRDDVARLLESIG